MNLLGVFIQKKNFPAFFKVREFVTVRLLAKRPFKNDTNKDLLELHSNPPHASAASIKPPKKVHFFFLVLLGTYYMCKKIYLFKSGKEGKFSPFILSLFFFLLRLGRGMFQGKGLYMTAIKPPKF